LLRAIGIFLKNLKEVHLASKNVSLKSMANRFRSNFNYPLPGPMTRLLFSAISFQKGSLMSQVGEKLKLMEPEALDFRFIRSSVLGSSVLGSSVLGDGTQEPERAKEQAEFNLFQSRLAKEVAMFSDYTWQLQLFHARQNEEKVAANLYLEQALAAATDTFSNHWMPCRRTSEAGVLPYVDEVMVSFAVRGFPAAKPCAFTLLALASWASIGLQTPSPLSPSLPMRLALHLRMWQP
jgi:hypothetical protein